MINVQQVFVAAQTGFCVVLVWLFLVVFALVLFGYCGMRMGWNCFCDAVERELSR